MTNLLKKLTFAAIIAAAPLTVALGSAPALAQNMMSMGEFMGSETAKDSGGEAIVHMGANGYVLELKNFHTGEGPDLHVLLLKDAEIMGEDTIKMAMANKTDIDLGSLKAIKGDQTYEIPAGFDITKYHTVAIWCQKVNKLFATAKLAM